MNHCAVEDAWAGAGLDHEAIGGRRRAALLVGVAMGLLGCSSEDATPVVDVVEAGLEVGRPIAAPAVATSASLGSTWTVVENGLSSNALTNNALTQNALALNGVTENSLTVNMVTLNMVTLNAVALNMVTLNALVENALTLNAFTHNALTLNMVTLNMVTLNGLALNALTVNSLTEDGLLADERVRNLLVGDSEFRAFLGNVYGCAMGAEDFLNVSAGGVSFELEGDGVALAPEWALGACDERCQAVVGECVGRLEAPDAASATYAAVLQDYPAVVATLRMAYECAMPAGTNVDLVLGGESFGTLRGRLGLAPEWGREGGTCDAACEDVVLECVRDQKSSLLRVLEEDENARKVMEYVYSCAMPPGANASIPLEGAEPLQLSGGLGLAPEWESGRCGVNCQRWVSACVLARTNAYGIPVQISLRGDHPALAPPICGGDDVECALQRDAYDLELAEFGLREGAYFGNLFASDARALHSCSGPGSNLPAVTSRFCSSNADRCILENRGLCIPLAVGYDLTCPEHLEDTDWCPQRMGPDPHGCQTISSVAGGYVESCLDSSSRPYDEVLTVYLREPGAVAGDGVCSEEETNPGDCKSGAWAEQFATGPLTTRIPYLLYDDVLVVDGDGVIVSDNGLGALTFGDERLPPVDEEGARWVGFARYDAVGELDWAFRMRGQDGVYDFDVTDDGLLVVSGWNVGRVGPDQGPAFVRAISRTGDALWQLDIDRVVRAPLRVDGPVVVRPYVMALEVAKDGDRATDDDAVFVARPMVTEGYPIDFRVGDDVFALGQHQAVLGRLGPDGSVLWLRVVDDPRLSAWESDHRSDLGITSPDGAIWRTRQMLPPADAQPGEVYYGLTKHAADGTEIWSDYAPFGDLAIVPGSDEVVVAGVERGLPPTGTLGDSQAVQKIGRDGEKLWRVEYPWSPGRDELRVDSLHVDRTGATFVGGRFTGTHDFGGVVLATAVGPLRPRGWLSEDGHLFLAKYSSDGELEWVKKFPAIYQASITGIAAIGGRVLMHGFLSASLAIEGLQLVGPTPDWEFAADSFIAGFPDPGAVADTRAPEMFQLPDDVAVAGTEAVGARFFYELPLASDDVDGPVTVTCSPTSGALLEYGEHEVACVARDRAGNGCAVPADDSCDSGRETFRVTVEDRTPPDIQLPGSIEVEAPDAVAVRVEYAVSGQDPLRGPVAVACSPESGTMFPVGATPVACEALDDAGNRSTGTFVVRVLEPQVDDVPPVIIVSGASTAVATSRLGATIDFTATADDEVDGAVEVECDRDPGALFPLGSSENVCRTRDRAGNAATVTMHVRVGYEWSGFLPPLDVAEGSLVDKGAVLAVRFALTGASAAVFDAHALVAVVPLDAGPGYRKKWSSKQFEAQYEESAGEYRLELETRTMQRGRWKLELRLGDGTQRTVVFRVE